MDNIGLYAAIHPAFADVQKFLSETNLITLAIGKHPVNGYGTDASVNEYATRPVEECFIECHIKYIDVQVIVWGEEKIGVANKKLCIEQPYDEVKDLIKLSGMVDFVTLLPGMFVVFFPHDAHEPGVISGDQAVAVRKIVFKVPV